MKRCPKCKREYDDELRFCLEDGTPLSSAEITPTIASPTVVLPSEKKGATTMPGAGRPDLDLPGEIKSDQVSLNPTQLKSAESPTMAMAARVVVGVLMVLVILGNLAAALTWGLIIARRIPIVFFYLAVMLLAIVRAPRHPKVSLLAGVALGFDQLESLVYIIVNRNVPESFYATLEVIDSFAAGAVIVVLTIAALSGRTSQAAT